eukprot:CAMPEP_0113307476 /NCGR_PEP_ID=MMETSP0010_2-20120614/6303_1 /TAXON_ID=216773 ORGANISM="Corethron hystrix, Strain 308" /NCGR_SAMPLE_ID=MMETSP0010_2 /ASSEMBLY_ACC=CAM_ASM_000155 /LENGTH=636 /DNA_ID=CAMNT_0000162333 /DNA_START=60 /DNA_END=1967 /DNA_ORIENTATION=- /assembly_acc=CAM_ASM_000155
MLPAEKKWEKMRVCNSDDLKVSEDQRQCLTTALSSYYEEVRISIQYWDTPTYEAWVAQILLSELLGVPTTIEANKPDVNMNFYNSENNFAIGSIFGEGEGDYGQWQHLARGGEIGDCTKANRDYENYEPCSNFVPEFWNYDDILKKMNAEELIEPYQFLGAEGLEGWFIPKFTALQDPALLSYLGLQNKNRKLAETFLQPVAWKEYCDIYSDSNCGSEDSTAIRQPKDDSENNRFFVEGLYKGFFRPFDDNDCLNKNCTGHIVDYPCGWGGFTEAQAYHLNIALESKGSALSNGYETSQMKEIWRAANATRSNVMMIYYNTDSIFEEFMGSDFEFMKVALPSPSEECFDARISIADRCSESLEVRRGDKLGVCDQTSTKLKKLLGSKLRNEDSPPAVKSPAYDALTNFRISEFQLTQLQRKVRTKDSEREAVCEWVVEHLDKLSEFIPRTFPRTIEPLEGYKYKGLHFFSVIFSSIAAVLMVLTAAMVHIYREKKAVKYAQTEFLHLLLFGAFSVCIGCIILAANTNDQTSASCLAAQWLINLGYTVELSATIVKVAAIIKLMNAAKKFRKVTLVRSHLFTTVFIIFLAAALYMLLWTLLDPYKKADEYFLKGGKNDQDETIVNLQHYCSSTSSAW